MRTSIQFVVAAVLLAAGCDRQLNPAYCNNPNHYTDPACQNASAPPIDGGAACAGSADCKNASLPVCYNNQCVACSPTDLGVCPSENLHACVNQSCVPCSASADCGGSELCIDNQCVAESGNLYYVAVAGSGDCSSAGSACTLATAFGKLTTAGSGGYIEFTDSATYTGTTISVTGVTVVMFGLSGSGSAATLSNIPISVGSNGSLTLVHLIVTAASADGLDCTNATLVTRYTNVTNSGSDGINCSGGTLTIEMGRIETNKLSGIYASSCTIAIDNDMIDHNNQGGADNNAGIMLIGSTSGTVRFNTIAYNNGQQHNADVPAGGLYCGAGNVDATDDLIIGNSPSDGGYNDIGYLHFQNQCETEYLNSSFQRTDQSVTTNDLGNRHQSPDPQNAQLTTDLHLSASTPQGIILDDGNSNCSAYPVDIDGEARPRVACDIGADECYTCGSNL